MTKKQNKKKPIDISVAMDFMDTIPVKNLEQLVVMLTRIGRYSGNSPFEKGWHTGIAWIRERFQTMVEIKEAEARLKAGADKLNKKYAKKVK